MVAQLDYSRVQRPSLSEKIADTNSYRVMRDNAVKRPDVIMKNALKKPVTFNFMCMIAVASTFDIIGIFLNEFPGVGVVISVIADLTFIPWFYFSGIKFNSKRIASMGTMSILEDIPVVGNLPLIVVNVIYSYYSS